MNGYQKRIKKVEDFLKSQTAEDHFRWVTEQIESDGPWSDRIVQVCEIALERRCQGMSRIERTNRIDELVRKAGYVRPEEVDL